MDETVRCAVCGKVVDSGDEVVQVNLGKLQEAQFIEEEDWGITHRGCFNRAMPSPKSALEEIRRLAKAG